MLRQQAQRVEGLRLAQQVRVVEHEDLRPGAGVRAPRRAANEARDLVKTSSDRREQLDGIVVPRGEREPGRRAARRPRPIAAGGSCRSRPGRRAWPEERLPGQLAHEPSAAHAARRQRRQRPHVGLLASGTTRRAGGVAVSSQGHRGLSTLAVRWTLRQGGTCVSRGASTKHPGAKGGTDTTPAHVRAP